MTKAMSKSCVDDDKGFSIAELRDFIRDLPGEAYIHTRNGEPLRYADFYPDDKILVIVEAL